MGSNYRVTYGVDLVFCIDATMSMNHILGIVKDNALNFYRDFKKTMDEKHKTVIQLRVRIVAFRDYYYDREKAMMVTDFFNLPEQSDDFQACVRCIEAEGGGDDPEDGLEALAYAMKSKWSTPGKKNRHVIVWDSENLRQTIQTEWLRISTSLPSGGEAHTARELWTSQQKDFCSLLRTNQAGIKLRTTGTT